MNEQFNVQNISIDDLESFAEHPFKLYEGKKFTALVNSIKDNGVLVPIIVRPKADKFEILSGHNRVSAAREAGLSVVPAVVREDLSDDEARLVVTVTNLIQRSFSDLSHSERATALSAHYNSIKKQGKRSDLIDSLTTLLGEDLTSVALRQKLSARDLVAKTYGLGGTLVAQYLRVVQLNDSLKNSLDNGKISLRTAVELSYLSADTQKSAADVLIENGCRIEIKTAIELRSAEIDGNLDSESVRNIILGVNNPKFSKMRSIKVNDDVISRYFNDSEMSDDDISDTVAKALEAWFGNNE